MQGIRCRGRPARFSWHPRVFHRRKGRAIRASPMRIVASFVHLTGRLCLPPPVRLVFASACPIDGAGLLPDKLSAVKERAPGTLNDPNDAGTRFDEPRIVVAIVHRDPDSTVYFI